MFSTGAHKTVFDALCLALRRAHENKSRTRRMTYKAVAYDNTLIYKGVPLAEIMVPPIYGSVIDSQAAFDLLVENCMTPGCEPTEGMIDLLPYYVIDWLGKWPDPMDKAVMLLWAIGRQRGNSVDYDDCSIIVSSENLRFGINNRGIMSRFNNGVKFSIKSPEKLLKATPMVRTFSSKQINMYREAYVAGEAETNALLAMFTAHPDAGLWVKARDAKVETMPHAKTMQRWEKLISCRPDPVGNMYREAYPVWLSASQFKSIFGTINSRNLDPTAMVRQNYIIKLYHHFYKNKDSK